MSLTTLVLAAGQGRRFGAKSKLLASLGGRAVLGHVFDRLAEAGLKTGFVALPDDSRFSALKALVPADFTAVEIDQGAVGMGRSLSAIAQKVPAGNAVLLVLGDQPLLTRTALHALIAHQSGTRIARLTHAGTAGHPVLFPARLVGELTALTGDQGPRHLIKQYGYEPVEVDDPMVLCDVDTPEALERLQAYA